MSEETSEEMILQIFEPFALKVQEITVLPTPISVFLPACLSVRRILLKIIQRSLANICRHEIYRFVTMIY
jgi:hypothetical protein